MKLLTVICLVFVTAAAAVYLWGQYATYTHRRAIAENRAMVEAELYRYAGASRDQPERVRVMCKMIHEKPAAELLTDHVLKTLDQNCGALGYR